MPDPSLFGISYLLPLKHMGPDVNFIPIRALPHRPTIYDSNYPIGQMAILNINPTTGAEGELWYLARFVTGLPDWRRIAIGAGGNTILTITTDDGAPTVVPDVAGNVNILGGNNLATAGNGPGNTTTVGIDPPVTIPNGGTNAIAMSTVNGIVKYDGTSLVTSTTALIDAANIETNTSQPAFLALSTAQNNVLGDGTGYTVIFATEIFDQTNSFDGVSTFTAPKSGVYLLGSTISLQAAFVVGNDEFDFNLDSTPCFYRLNTCNLYNSASASTYYKNSCSFLVYMVAGDTARINLFASGAAKTISLNGGACSFWGYLVC